MAEKNPGYFICAYVISNDQPKRGKAKIKQGRRELRNMLGV